MYSESLKQVGKHAKRKKVRSNDAGDAFKGVSKLGSLGIVQSVLAIFVLHFHHLAVVTKMMHLFLATHGQMSMFTLNVLKTKKCLKPHDLELEIISNAKLETTTHPENKFNDEKSER